MKEKTSKRALRLLSTETESNGDGTLDTTVDAKLNDFDATTSLLKVTESIKAELVPGTENNLDKKEFTWKLVKYSKSEVQLQFNFKFPEFISVDKVDTMKITFNNADNWVSPTDETKTSIPNGFV